MVAREQGGESRRLTVVGIGASAGGLVALQGFFDALPADTGMAFVVVTHMDPKASPTSFAIRKRGRRWRNRSFPASSRAGRRETPCAPGPLAAPRARKRTVWRCCCWSTWLPGGPAPEARPNIQVFASDLDEVALTKARDGLYPEAIEADVSPERLARFFVKEDNYYRVRRELRDVVLFTNHSVLRDPPFSRLDLIICRNLLIYLQRELQQKVFEIFHYALNPERYLFLGSAESVGMVHGLFGTLDKRQRIYQARPWRGEQPHVPRLPLAVHQPVPQRPVTVATQPGPAAREAAVPMAAYHLETLEELAPPSVLVDEAYRVVQLSQTAGRYLQIPAGPI